MMALPPFEGPSLQLIPITESEVIVGLFSKLITESGTVTMIPPLPASDS